MARNRKQQAEADQAATDTQDSFDESSPPMIGGTSGAPPDTSTPLVAAAPVVGSVQLDAPGAPRHQRYRVINGGFLMVNGNKTIVRAGKIIDGANYDLKNLLDQGLKIEAVTDEEYAATQQQPQ